MSTCACVLETYVRTDSTIYTARLIIEHPREWLASLADKIVNPWQPPDYRKIKLLLVGLRPWVREVINDNHTSIIGAIQKSMSVTSDNCTIIL